MICVICGQDLGDPHKAIPACDYSEEYWDNELGDVYTVQRYCQSEVIPIPFADLGMESRTLYAAANSDFGSTKPAVRNVYRRLWEENR